MTLPVRADAVTPGVDVWQNIKRRFRQNGATEATSESSRRLGDGSKGTQPHRLSLLKVPSRLFKSNTHQKTPCEPSAPSEPAVRLPPELWVLIFSRATALDSGPLESSGQLSFLTMSTVRWTAYRRCMRTKLVLSLVSRSFRQMSECILYETIWIRRAAQAKALAHTLLTYDLLYHTDSPGQHIRHLHIETPTFERCAPEDVRTILAYAPQLHAYTDNHSVRRWRYDPAPNPASSPASLFALLTRPDNALRRLSWTTYSDEPFHFDMTPLFSRSRTCARLEYLELSTCSAFDLPDRLFRSAVACSPPVSMPGLKALKVSLDNTTFMVLSTWSMPELRNLSVVSADFSYAGDGFSAFFRAHGAQIHQLELGHSSSQISEQRLTPLPPGATSRLKLAEWLPNLKQFICSADAEWSWLEPDHIAPHVLLPAHPTLEFIGIRDIDARLRTDADAFVRHHHPPHLAAADEDVSDPAPFFPLLEQLSGLLRDDAFPALRYMRDLSEESHRMRTKDPEPRIVRFWERVILRCSQKGVWCEDWEGVNVTMRGLKRASMRKQEDAKWNWF